MDSVVGLGGGRELDSESRVAAAESSAQHRRSFYLRAEPDSVFAVAHLPQASTARGTGVVMCPSFGWDEDCAHRVKRNWADSLSAAGYPTIRFDVPGTGDSGGSPRDPDRLAAWLAAVDAAANWLREEAGCVRVVGFGIGFGGMLAWAGAADGTPIDDLMLWATPTSGRRLGRELRAAAMLQVDMSVDFETEEEERVCATAPPLDRGLVDESGQFTTRETLDALSQLDLTARPLPAADGRRVLVFTRSGDEADTAVTEFFSEAGAEVTEANGDGYTALMQYVQQAQVPTRAIAESVEWLNAGPSREREPPAATSGADRLTVDVLELVEDGIEVRERPVTVEVDGRQIKGIVTEPVGVPAVGLCAVFLSGGSDRRIGPNKMWVETSRRWAARGVHCARMDPPGIGDSDGDERVWDKVPDHYDEQHTQWVLDLLGALDDAGLPNRFVLTGFCVGAYRSVQAALKDRRVVGAFAIGLPFFFASWWMFNVRDWWTVDWVPQSTDNWKKTTVVRMIQRVIAVLSHARRFYVRLTNRGPDRAERALREITGNGAEVLILFKANSHELRDLRADGRMQRFEQIPRLEMLRIPGHDQRFRPPALQHYINTAVDEALERVIEAGLNG